MGTLFARISYYVTVVAAASSLITAQMQCGMNGWWNSFCCKCQYQWLWCLEVRNDSRIIVSWNSCKSTPGIPDVSFQPAFWCDSWGCHGELVQDVRFLRFWHSFVWSEFLHKNAVFCTCAYIHPFNGPFSRTTWVSRYQKGKNQSGFYWSKRQWVAVASPGPYASLHLAPDR